MHQPSTTTDAARPRLETSDWVRVAPFIGLHLACLSVFAVGISWTAVMVASVTFFARVFGLTGFYHRYFSHRAFKTSRGFQFVGAFLGGAAGQRGPLWWAAHHRDHHRHSDTDGDVHSPHVHGFWWSHMGWFMRHDNFNKGLAGVKDFTRFPELVWIDRYDYVPPLALAVAVYGLGVWLGGSYPSLNTSGMQLLIWGFLLSTVALYHTTYAINSLAHTHGSRRFPTKDESRNNLWLALLTFGEGWHNNHHYYPSAARQGFYWWEVDVTYYLLRICAWFGLVWDLREVPGHVLVEGRQRDAVRLGNARIDNATRGLASRAERTQGIRGAAESADLPAGDATSGDCAVAVDRESVDRAAGGTPLPQEGRV